MISSDEKKILTLIKILPLFIIVFSIIITYILISNKNSKFEQEIINLKTDSINKTKKLIKNEVERIHRYIKNEEDEAIVRIKDNIKQQVYIAHAIASSIYNNNKNKSKEEITKLIKDAQRDIRFNGGRGYFFIYDLNGISISHPIKPKREGKSFLNVQDINGKYIVRESINIANNKNKEGFLTWFFTKPNEIKKEYRKIGFIKKFEPYNWFIGTGEYEEDYKKELKKSLLKKIHKIKYGLNGYIFIVNQEGIYLSHYKKENIDKNRINLKDANGFMITKEIIKAGQKKEGDYISYIGTIQPTTGKSAEKISYIKGYRPWNWAIGTGIYTNDINNMVLDKRETLEKENKEQIISIFLTSFIVFVILFILSILFSNVIKNKFIKYRKKVNKNSDTLRKLNKILEQKVEKRTRSLNQQTKKVTDLLNNAAQGFLSFDKDFLIHDEYSLECEYLLGSNLQEKDITELLFSSQSKKIPFFKETIIDVLEEENKLTCSLLLSLLPSEMIINKRAVLIEYKVLSDNKIMIILTNITDKKKLKNKIAREQNILKMIVAVVSDSSHFYETKESFENLCNDCTLLICKENSSEDNVNIINALIHTYKGLFAQLYMNNTVKCLHDIETKLYLFIEGKGSNEELVSFKVLHNITRCMEDDLNVIINTLGESFLEEHTQIKVDENVINNLENKVLSINLVDDEYKKELEEILNNIKKLKNKSLYHYLSVYPKLSQQLAISLNKSIHPFDIIGDKKVFVPDNFKQFINSLVHVFRNCCDHGIEIKEKRIELKKSEIANISCTFEKVNNNLSIIISDDGQGIDIELLKEKILKKKLCTKIELNSFSAEKIISFIFDSNFSTYDNITHISGRGIGLSAVKIELLKLNGVVAVETEINKGTKFSFDIPLLSNLLDSKLK